MRNSLDSHFKAEVAVFGVHSRRNKSNIARATDLDL